MKGYVKQVFALLCAALAGYVFGIYTAATRVPEIQFFGGAPEWMIELENVSIIAAGGAGVCAIAWVYIDYKYEVTA